MHRGLLIILFFLITESAVHSQTPYSNHLDNTVRWYKHYGGIDGINIYYSFFTYFLSGDTVIDSEAYFKEWYVRRDSTVHVMFPGPPTVDTSGPKFAGFIREDSTNRFWGRGLNDTVEFLKHDFNLGIGDTFPNSNCGIDSMDTVYLGAIPLTRWEGHSQAIGHGVIEGIGATGPLCGMGIEGNTLLICYVKQNVWLHLDSTWSCDEWVSIDNSCASFSITNQTMMICNGDSVYLQGAWQTSNGNYLDSLQNTMGCDSLIITALTIDFGDWVNLSDTICSGDSTYLQGGFQTQAGTYIDSFINLDGCDSLVSTVLSVIPVYITPVTAHICNGESILLGGAIQTMPGIFYDTLIATTGCDSVVETALAVTDIDATVTQSGDTLIAQPGYDTYQWYDCITSSTVPGAMAHKYTPSQTGDYAVIINQNSCTDTSTCQTLVISSAKLPARPIIEVAPNPTSGVVSVKARYLNGAVAIRVYNLLGSEQKLSVKQNGSVFILDINHLPDGLYFIEVSGENYSDVIRLVKE